MRVRLMLLCSILAIICAGCGATPTEVAAERGVQSMDAAVISTSIGDLSVDSIRFVDEVHGVQAGEGQTILLVLLKRVDGGELTTEEILSARDGVEAGILGSDGTPYICTMGGILDSGETAVGCMVPASLETWQFYWGENPLVELVAPGE